MSTYRVQQVAELLGVSADTVRRWCDDGRLPSSGSGRQRTIDGVDLAAHLRDRDEPFEPDTTRASSARNRFTGIVTRVERDGLVAVVEICAPPHRVVSMMTRDAADELELAPGDLASAVIKATNVVVEPMRPLALVGAVVVVLVVGACSSEATTDAPTTAGDRTPTTTAALEGEITVSAAASLTDVFEAVGDAFVDRHPATSVEFNFGSSGQLATQIVEGAPADVAAFADTAPMQVLDDADLLAAPAEVFATNELVLVTPPGNPAGIASLADLAGASTVSLCVVTAPCGKFAEQLLSQGGIKVQESSVTRGQDVRATLAAVTEGDADAAIVYLSDAMAVGSRVEVVDVPEAAAIVASYPIAVLADSDAVDVAEAFAAFVRSDDGQALLSEAGFGPP